MASGKKRVRPFVVHSVPQNKTFSKIKNRTENTKNGVPMFDRASSDRFLAVFFLPETLSLFFGAAILSPHLAGASPATYMAGMHPG